MAGAGRRFHFPGMSKYAGEQVLVVKRGLFERLGAFEGLRAEGAEKVVTELMKPENYFFMDRDAAEEDPAHKQIIPYCIFRCGGRLFHYTRGKSGGESRLHAKISVGVGGHVNPVDMENGREGMAAYEAAVTREIEEELDLPGKHDHRVIALINDDSSAVGRVHLGIVHLVELDSENVDSRETALLDPSFSALEELNGAMFDRLETWSAFCVRHLAENLVAAG